MRIFINHVNTYSGVVLARTLRRLNGVLNRIFGTVQGIEDGGASPEPTHAAAEKGPAVPPFIRRLISKRNPQQLLKNLLSCSLAVFDLHNADLDEVEAIVKRLKSSQVSQPMTVVLISSVIVWEGTKVEGVLDPPGDADTDELAEKGAAFGDTQDGRRILQEVAASEANSPAAAEGGVSGDKGLEARVSSRDGGQRDSRSGDKEVPERLFSEALKPKIIDGSADFERRTPLKSYERWKMLETLVLSLNAKENVRAVVVASGVMYGYGEDLFFEAFKAAWLGLRSHRLVGEGTNLVPTVHVQDLCSLVKALATSDKASQTAGPYHVAVDAAFSTQRHLLRAVVHEMGEPFAIPTVSKERAALLKAAQFLSLNLRFHPSPLMNDPEFPWHAKEGLVRSVKTVAREFCEWRSLRQLKVLVTGPPGSGKTALSEKIAQHFNIKHIRAADVVEEARAEESLGEGSLPRGPGLGVPSQQGEDAKRKKRPPQRRSRFDADTMARLFQKKLSENVCRYRGFVLDGFPKTYDECKKLFLKPKDRERLAGEEEAEAGGGADAEEETEDLANTEGSPKLTLDALLAPDFVILLKASADTCETRLMELSPSAVVPQHNDKEGFARRFQVYMQQNESTEGQPCTCDFFQERHVEVLTLPVDGRTLADCFASSLVYLARLGKVNNFLLREEDEIAEQEELLRSQEEEEEKRTAALEAEKRQEENALLERRRARDMTRLQRITEHEQQLLLFRSIPLRRYLMQYVVPTLSEGLLDVCRVAPEDPVSYLAEFLFAKAQRMATDEH